MSVPENGAHTVKRILRMFRIVLHTWPNFMGWKVHYKYRILMEHPLEMEVLMGKRHSHITQLVGNKHTVVAIY